LLSQINVLFNKTLKLLGITVTKNAFYQIFLKMKLPVNIARGSTVIAISAKCYPIIPNDIFLYLSLCTDIWKLLSQRIFEFIHYANYDDVRKERFLRVPGFWFTCYFTGYKSIRFGDEVSQTKYLS
jgi:hypothetical protein